MLFGSYAKTTIKLPLKELGKHCEISHELIFQGKKSKHEFKVRLQIRQALRVKEEDKISYKKLVITQIPPSFKSQGVSAGVQGRVVSTTVPMEETKQSPKKSAPKTAPQKEELPPDPPLPPELPELPDNIRELDVRDPDNIGNYIRYYIYIYIYNVVCYYLILKSNIILNRSLKYPVLDAKYPIQSKIN